MLSIRHAIPVILATTFMACADAAGPVQPSPSLSLLGEGEFLPGIPILDPFAEILSDGSVIESSRGSGHIFFMNERRTFAFTAKNKSDGTTQGQFQINNRADGPFFKEHGVVTCLVVDGNQSWVGGYVTHSDGGTEGISRVWRAIDNGEGTNEPPDMITLAQSFGPSGTESICLARPPLADAFLQPIDDGNIQVTDGDDFDPEFLP
jgi:hypothetical protein